MSKICIVIDCEDCKNFDHQYYGYNHTCRKLGRKIELDNGFYKIPEDCPLDDYEE